MTKIKIGRLSALATNLNGAADSGRYDRISTDVVQREIAGGDIFGFLARELGSEVDLSRLTDVDRLALSRQWRGLSKAYETQQFHVNRSGLALLVAYLLHDIYCLDYVPPR